MVDVLFIICLFESLIHDFSIEDDSDREILEDSIVAASQKLIEEIDNYTEEEMAKYTAFFGGMGGF